MYARSVCIVVLLALGGCHAYSDTLEPPGDVGYTLVLSQAYGVRNTSFELDLWFAGLPPLTEGTCYYSHLDFGKNDVGSTSVGSEDRLPGCVGVRRTVIIGADAELGPRTVHLTFHRPAMEGVLDGFADFTVVDQEPQDSDNGP